MHEREKVGLDSGLFGASAYLGILQDSLPLHALSLSLSIIAAVKEVAIFTRAHLLVGLFVCQQDYGESNK